MNSANIGTTETVIFGLITNSPLMALGTSVNMAISKNAKSYTVGDLFEDIQSIAQRAYRKGWYYVTV